VQFCATTLEIASEWPCIHYHVQANRVKEHRNRPLEPLIFTIRGQRVILDSDLARLYGVRTYRLNEAVKRNRLRFPDDFAFQLTSREYEELRSYPEATETPDTEGDRAMSSQIAMTSDPIRPSKKRPALYRPWVFSEHGALMAANVLRSERAIEMSIFVIRAFVQIRERLAVNASVLKRLAEIDKTLLEHDDALVSLWTKLQPLLSPPPETPRRRIGFGNDES
jgi:hypothetical protein